MSSPSNTPVNDEFDAEEDKVTKLKSSLWLPLGKLVDETTITLGKNATPQFIGSLTELVWTQIENAAGDLESFARHAGRKTITMEDVLLLARRNENLVELLKAHSREHADEGRN